MKRTSIVLGLGFGDEGKGLTTDLLCLQHPGSLVVRFSGGHQVGHTVVTSDGTRHVFSNFGSGTLRKTPTFWSQYCTVFPSALVREWDLLSEKGIFPKLYLSPLALITTPFDIAFNRAEESLNLHGSVGVGFGATIERNTTHFKLYAQDLAYPFVLRQKLKAIGEYYLNRVHRDKRADLAEVYLDQLEKFPLEIFLQHCDQALRYARVITPEALFPEFEHLIFEGSQGILLDMHYGFFPHVTRSFTTSRNAMEMIRDFNLPAPEMYYVTRAYQTRHGNGPMTNEELPIKLINTEGETNVAHEWQGDFRRTVLDLDLLNYALVSDANHCGTVKKHLVVTCLDQLAEPLRVTQKGRLFTPATFQELLAERYLFGARFESLWESRSPCGEQVQIIQHRQPSPL